MDKKIPLEIERKFIIKMPTENFLSHGVTWHITQVYLKPEHEGENRRVRRAECRGQVVYTLTAKVRKNDLSCYEDERVIDHASFLAFRAQAREDSAPVEKIRHAVPYHGHILEIDVYPFWQNYAILEVELQSEKEVFEFPHEIKVIREVTADPRYKNTNIARHLFAYPGEPLPVN